MYVITAIAERVAAGVGQLGVCPVDGARPVLGGRGKGGSTARMRGCPLSLFLWQPPYVPIVLCVVCVSDWQFSGERQRDEWREVGAQVEKEPVHRDLAYSMVWATLLACTSRGTWTASLLDVEVM